MGDVRLLFEISCFLDELILIAGTYLLSRRLFRYGPTLWLVTFGIWATSIYPEQIWFSFRLFAFFPLCAYFVLEGVQTRRSGSIALAYFIAVTMCLAGLGYIGIMAAFVLFVWHVLCEVLWRRRGRYAFEWTALVWSAGTVASLGFLFLIKQNSLVHVSLLGRSTTALKLSADIFRVRRARRLIFDTRNAFGCGSGLRHDVGFFRYHTDAFCAARGVCAVGIDGKFCYFPLRYLYFYFG